MKKSIIFFPVLLCGLGLAAWAQPQDADQNNSESTQKQTFTICSGPNKQERLRHDAEMVADMNRRDAEVRADHEAYNKHLQEWLQKNKDADNARRLAEAAAVQAQIEARQKAIQEAATISVINANNAYTNWMNSH